MCQMVKLSETKAFFDMIGCILSVAEGMEFLKNI